MLGETVADTLQSQRSLAQKRKERNSLGLCPAFHWVWVSGCVFANDYRSGFQSWWPNSQNSEGKQLMNHWQSCHQGNSGSLSVTQVPSGNMRGDISPQLLLWEPCHPWGRVTIYTFFTARQGLSLIFKWKIYRAFKKCRRHIWLIRFTYATCIPLHYLWLWTFICKMKVLALKEEFLWRLWEFYILKGGKPGADIFNTS